MICLNQTSYEHDYLSIFHLMNCGLSTILVGEPSLSSWWARPRDDLGTAGASMLLNELVSWRAEIPSWDHMILATLWVACHVGLAQNWVLLNHCLLLLTFLVNFTAIFPNMTVIYSGKSWVGHRLSHVCLTKMAPNSMASNCSPRRCSQQPHFPCDAPRWPPAERSQRPDRGRVNNGKWRWKWYPWWLVVSHGSESTKVESWATS